MLLAEELAFVAIDPDKGRPELGTREQLKACLAGLLVAELLIEGLAGPGARDDSVVITGRAPASATLAAASEVVGERGPKVKAILSHMDRGLCRRLGAGTWDTVVAGLVEAGLLAPGGGLRPRNDVLDQSAQDAAVDRLRAAAAGDQPLEARVALVLSMAGPAQLLEVVAPDRKIRRHARARIDHALDGTDLEPVGKIVRRLISEAASAAAAGAVIAGGAATAG